MLDYVLNFIFIAVSIAAFMLPFYLWYVLKEHVNVREFNLSLEGFFSSRQANYLVFSWAAAEAVVWYVIPEFLLLLVIFMRVKNKRQMLLFDVAGTIFGTFIAMLMRLPEHLISNLPYIQEKMVAQTKIWYEDMGVLGLANQPFSGVPYKVFTHLAWQYEYLFILFLVVAVVVRMFRYVVAYGLFVSLYPKLHKLVNRNYIPLALIAILIFSILLYNTYEIYS